MPNEYTPLTNILVCAGVPLDSTYSDTIKFTSAGAQQGFFSGKAKFRYNNASFQRVSSMITSPRISYSMRVPANAEDLRDCNYVCFQNQPYGSKWFYAFIVSINMKNPNDTEIIYQIDFFQTYLFDFEVLPSMVIREHTKTDNVFEHLAPEPFGSSDMIVNKVNQIELSGGSVYIVVGVSSTPDDQTVAGQSYNQIYSGVELHEFTNAGAATSFIRTYDKKAKADAITCVFMSPWSINSSKTETKTISVPSDLAGYTPRNKKLLSYPYIKLEVSNRQGQMKDYYYEMFAIYSGSAPPSPGQCNFQCATVGGINPAAYLFANNYKGGNFVDYDEVLEISGFPTCAWSTNAFANWWGGEGIASTVKGLFNLGVDTIGAGLSNARNTIASLIGGQNISMGNSGRPGGISLGSGGWGSLVKGAAGLGDVQQDFVTGLLKGAADIGAEAWVRSRCPGLLKGSAHGTSLNFSSGKVGFDIKEMSITPETAAIIDDFFDMYGYAVNRIKVPEMEGRNAWNYVQTSNVIIKGSMPVEAMNVIKSCFNQGIRFWHNGDWVGDYSKPNYPA